MMTDSLDGDVQVVDSGMVFCLSTGPSKEAVMRVHERAGHPTSEVYEVSIEIK